jgi:transcriptional regulator with XRE-family HTH domain
LDDRETQAARLRTLRKQLMLTQRELAREFGVTPGAVAQWESGDRRTPGPILRLVELYERELHVEVPAAPLVDDSSFLRPVDGLSTAATSLLWLTLRAFGGSVSSPIGLRIRKKAIERYARTLDGARGLQLKLAQLFSYLDFLVPGLEGELARVVAVAAKPMPPSLVSRIVAEELGKAPRELFAEWSSEPAASASIGQVHRATLASGERVAVKVQYPDVRARLEHDLSALDALRRVGSLLFPDAGQAAFFDDLRRALLEECDYRVERRNQTTFGELFADRADLVVPSVFPQLSTSRVLTTSLASGASLEDFARTASQAARDRAARAVWDFYRTPIRRLRQFNADPHPGNFLFTDAAVVCLDFGRVTTLSPNHGENWFGLVKAILNRDRAEARRVFLSLGNVGEPAALFNFDAAYRLQLALAQPYLFEGGYTFTNEYLRLLWQASLDDRNGPNRRYKSYTSDLAFMNQLFFGVGSLLVRLGGRVFAREQFLEQHYAPDEPKPAPYSREEFEESFSGRR